MKRTGPTIMNAISKVMETYASESLRIIPSFIFFLFKIICYKLKIYGNKKVKFQKFLNYFQEQK